MLSEQQIQSNREEFISLIKSVEIQGADIDGLVSYLENSDFFIAPASTQYHGSYRGGLCEHSLLVFKNLVELVKTFGYREVIEQDVDEKGVVTEERTVRQHIFSYDSLKVVALLHEINKINFYHEEPVNRKVYSDEGKKYDELGKFDWVATKVYKVNDANDRLLAGSHSFNSFLVVNRFIPLSHEEVVALINHHAGTNKAENTDDLSSILEKYSLTVFLHMADILSTYYKQEKVANEQAD